MNNLGSTGVVVLNRLLPRDPANVLLEKTLPASESPPQEARLDSSRTHDVGLRALDDGQEFGPFGGGDFKLVEGFPQVVEE